MCNGKILIYIRKSLEGKVAELIKEALSSYDYEVITFDKGDVDIMLADGIRVLTDERALIALRQLKESRRSINNDKIIFGDPT